MARGRRSSFSSRTAPRPRTIPRPRRTASAGTSTTASRTTQQTRPTTTSPQPTQQQRPTTNVPVQQGQPVSSGGSGMLGGFVSSLVGGFAGNMLANTLLGGMKGGEGTKEAACGDFSREFLSCLEKNSSEIYKCQTVFDKLNKCRKDEGLFEDDGYLEEEDLD